MKSGIPKIHSNFSCFKLSFKSKNGFKAFRYPFIESKAADSIDLKNTFDIFFESL